MKISYLIILTLMLSTIIKPQQTTNAIGGGIGIGSFLGDFPSQTTFGGKLFFESPSPISVFNKLQFHFSFGQKVEKFLPGSYSYNHYSYYTSFGLSGMFKQPFTEVLYIEEGIGIIYLNDRSFDDINKWNFGIIISLASGMPISNNIDLSLNIDYGITINNTNSSYFIFMINGKYYFMF